MPPLTVKRNGLAPQVIEGVRRLIAERAYGVGDRLPSEAELCALFGVGRSTIREAIRVLAHRGIVDVRHGEGTFVGASAARESFEERIGRAALKDIYEARRILELPLAELAAERRKPRDVTAMRAALRQRERACRSGDVGAYADADFAFHVAVARAAKNRALLDLYVSFVDVVKPLLVAATTSAYVRAEHDTLHAQLCEAVADGDVERTRRLVRSHLARSLKGVGAIH
jgi:GntR family transcriptional regulator, transcriptional repressor for pyruvate dehydrogenase complex